MVAIKSAVELVFVTPKQAETIFRNAKIIKNMKRKKNTKNSPTFFSIIVTSSEFRV